MRSLATWSYRHRRIVLGIWLLALVGTNLLSIAAGSAYSNNFNLPNTESTRALALLRSVAPKESGDSEQIVFGTLGGAKVTDPAIQQRVAAMLARVAQLVHVVSVASPFSASGAKQGAGISRDGTVGFATVALMEVLASKAWRRPLDSPLLGSLARAVVENRVETALEGPVIQPVFRSA